MSDQTEQQREQRLAQIESVVAVDASRGVAHPVARRKAVEALVECCERLYERVPHPHLASIVLRSLDAYERARYEVGRADGIYVEARRAAAIAYSGVYAESQMFKAALDAYEANR